MTTEHWLFGKGTSPQMSIGRKDNIWSLRNEAGEAKVDKYGVGFTLGEAIRDYNRVYTPKLKMKEEEDFWLYKAKSGWVDLLGDLYLYIIGFDDNNNFVISRGRNWTECNTSNLSFILEFNIDFSTAIEEINRVNTRALGADKLSLDITKYQHNNSYIDWEDSLRLVVLRGFDEPAKNVCDCGAKVAGTTHADWCSTVG